MNETILIVEDEEMIRNLIRLYLEKEQYQVIEATDGMEAQAKFLKHQPCLVILDLMLPKLSGEKFCEWVRSKEVSQETSIIMLSAKSQVDDKVNGLKLGADAYLTKPFNPDELIAYVEAVLRRTGRFCQKITFDGLSIMVRKGEVTLNGVPIKLTKHEFNILYVLMSNPNSVFSREQIIEQLYPNQEQDILDRTIDAHIKKLRIKINDQKVPKRIQTVRGMGYKFVPSQEHV